MHGAAVAGEGEEGTSATASEAADRGRLARISPDTWALVAIVAAVLIANLPALLGFFDTNPLDFRSGLVQSVTNGLLTGKSTIDPSNGFTSQAIGHLAALDLLHLRLPWWNPYEGTGMPLLGETQAAALFAPTLLTAIPNGQLYEHMLLEAIAGICTCRLLIRVGLTRAAALAGGVAFALNGKFAWFADAGVNPLAFLPMLLLGVERAFAAARDGRSGGWRLLAIAGALSVYAGFPEVAYVDALMVVGWVLWRGGCVGRPQLGSFALKMGLGAVAGTLLAAPMLLAMADYLSHAYLANHVGSALGSRHLALGDFPQLLMPYVFGPVNGAPRSSVWIMVGGYLSVVGLLFAVLGLISPGRRGLKIVMFVWALLVFSRIYGVPVLDAVLGVLPEMSRIQFFRYATAALELPIIVLAALGIDDLTRGRSGRRRRLVAASVGAMAAIGGAALAAGPVIDSLKPTVRHSDAFEQASIAWGLGTAAAVGLIALARGARARATLLVLVVVIDAVVLFAVPQFGAPRRTTVDHAPVTYLRRHLGESRFYTLGPIAPDYGSYFGLGSIAVDDFPPNSFARYVHRRLDPLAQFVGFRPAGPTTAAQELLRHLDGYRAAAVGYVLVHAGNPLPDSHRGLRLVLRTPTTWIYRVEHAAPYFSAAGCQVTSTQRTSALLTCRRTTTLVRRETLMAGWSAQIDGRPASIRRVDGLFQAVTVPAGTHRVTYAFAPVGIGWALLGLLAGVVLLATPALARRTRGTRRPSRPPGVAAAAGAPAG